MVDKIEEVDFKKVKSGKEETAKIKKHKKKKVDGTEKLMKVKSENANIEVGDETIVKQKKKKRKVESDVPEESVKVKKVKFEGQQEKAKGKENKTKGKEIKKVKLQKKIEEKKKKFKDGKEKKDKEDKEPVEKLTKKEEREKQKKLKAERKAKKISNEGVFDIGLKAKKVWEEVRNERCPAEKKESLLKELHSLVKGNVEKIIFAHDTVRVIECLMALGSPEIREELFQEMKEHILKMAKSKYGNFFVQKLLRYGTKEQKAHIFKTMNGHIANLMKHKTAGFVVELAYNDYANAAQKNCMLQEFLGPEYRLFKEPELRTVPELLAKHPEKKKELVKNMGVTVEVLIQKGTFNHSLVHTVIYNYLLVAEPAKRAECIEQLREAILHMIHSRDGAMAGLMAIWHGTNKDRKTIIKSFKTHVSKIAMEEYGHLVLLGIFDCVDDTRLVGKAIVGELTENLEEIAANKYGVRVLKYLMAGRDPVYTGPDTLNILKQGDGNEYSKKDGDVRQSELVGVSAGPALTWVSTHLATGLYDPPTTITFTAIVNHAPQSEQLTQLLQILAEEATKPFIPGDAEPNIVESRASNMMLKKIIQKDKERAAKGEKTFSSIVLDTMDEDGLEAWVTCNRGAFLLVTMLETGIEEVIKVVKEKANSMMKTLKRQKTTGVEVLLKKLAEL